MGSSRSHDELYLAELGKASCSSYSSDWTWTDSSFGAGSSSQRSWIEARDSGGPSQAVLVAVCGRHGNARCPQVDVCLQALDRAASADEVERNLAELCEICAGDTTARLSLFHKRGKA
jgi:hypothetical protein